MLRLELHIREGNNRGAAKEEACQIMVVLLTQHYAEDGLSMAPLLLDDLVPQPPVQQAFELWAHTNTTREQQDQMKENALKRQNEIAMLERKELLANKTMGRNFLDVEEVADLVDDPAEGAGGPLLDGLGAGLPTARRSNGWRRRRRGRVQPRVRRVCKLARILDF